MKTTGIGFIGSGFARKVQAPAFEMLEGVKLVGAASPNNAEEFAGEFGMPFHSNDWKELVNREDVDLICISSPPVFHYEQVMYALENGKHVLCEKPFAMNFRQAEDMLNLASDKKVLNLIDHELRFNPGVKMMKSIVEEGRLGNIYFARALSHLSGRRDPGLKYYWWFDKEWGGGIWGAIGSHMIDLLRFFVGEVGEACVKLDSAVKFREDKSGKERRVSADEMASASLKFQNGAVGSIFTSIVSNENRFEIELTGSLGSIRLDQNDRVWFAPDGKPYEEVDVKLSPEQQEISRLHEVSRISARSLYSKGFMHFAEKISGALLRGETTVPGAATFADGLEIQKVLDKGWMNL